MMEVFQNIYPSTLRSRMKGEYIRMKPLYKSIIVKIEDEKIIFLIEESENKVFKFIVSTHYPFEPPIVYVNDNPFSYFHRLNNRFTKILKYLKGKDCLCCSSYLCKKNWFPIHTMKNIIDELDDIKELKYNIIIKTCLDKIKQKFLNRDIDLDSWLFHIADPSALIPV